MKLPTRVSISEAARLARVAPKTVRRWEKRGRISVDRSGLAPMVSISELMRIGVLDQVGQGPKAPMGGVGEGMEETESDRTLDMMRRIAEANRRAEAAERDRDAWRAQAQQLAEALTQLALPAAREEARPAEAGERQSGWARWWAWFVGRGEGS